MPSIPPRALMRDRAMGSIWQQTYPVSQLSLSVDHEKSGAAANRQRALDGITTEWTAFLDDDDAFLPLHVEKLVRFAQDMDADYVFSWFHVINGVDPFPQHFGKKYDVKEPTHTTITVLVKTELARSIGFRPAGGGEDWDFTVRCIEAGATIEHLPERTWNWYHGGHNTSGRADRW
jgi:glycosyltransferase involved in cell wall biosynthesis